MKSKVKNISLTAGLLIFLLISSCTNSYEQMINNINENYFTLTPTPAKESNLLDKDFDQEQMLEIRYTFIEGFNSSLVAPKGAAKYLWVEENLEDGQVQKKTLCNERIYAFLPENDFEVNKESKLVLTVTDEKGTEYIDTTIIVVLNRR